MTGPVEGTRASRASKLDLVAVITIIMVYHGQIQPLTMHKEMEMNMLLRLMTLLDFHHALCIYLLLHNNIHIPNIKHVPLIIATFPFSCPKMFVHIL